MLAVSRSHESIGGRILWFKDLSSIRAKEYGRGGGGIVSIRMYEKPTTCTLIK